MAIVGRIFFKKHKFLNRALKILLATNGLVLLAGAMLGPIYAMFVEEIGGNLLVAGTAGGIFALVAGITIFLIGKFEDKIKEQELAVAAGYIVMSLGFFGYLLVKSPLTLFIVEIIIGFGEALYSLAFDAVYSKHLDKKLAASQWGSWEAMQYLVMALGAFVGGVIANYLGFSILFIIMGIFTLLSAIIILLLPRKVL